MQVAEASTDISTPVLLAPSRWRRVLPWALLVGLLVVAQAMLFALTVRHEHTREQDRVDAAASAAVADVRQLLARDLQGLQALLWNSPQPQQWQTEAAGLLRDRRELLRIEWRDHSASIAAAVESPYRGPLFSLLGREELDLDTQVACTAALKLRSPVWSRSYFVPQPGGLGVEVLDVCLPVDTTPGQRASVAATFALGAVAEAAVPADLARAYEMSFVEGDGTRLARAGSRRGAGVFVAERLVDLPGVTLALRVDSVQTAPRWLPNLVTSLVLGLSIALIAVVALLVHDVRRRADVEERLGEELTLRRAMEDSLVTGLRARDMSGRITYVNPAFCAMVGFDAADLIGRATPPYWPPEMRAAYEARHAQRMAEGLSPDELRDGFETTFMRAGGERFPVLVFEAPLVGPDGRQRGWMSAALDLSAQRRVEEISRQQQERLQASARLTTVGEMASLLSHELNQPLAAIASYASGSLNLMNGRDSADPATATMVREATQRIAEQAERAGRVIKSVHGFVRRREHSREEVTVDQLVDGVLPLLRLQARKSAARLELDLGQPPPPVACDRTMVEQVILNLTRNALQAMEAAPPERRVLTLTARRFATEHGAWVRFSVTDRGPGISDAVAARLFTPFFTTKPEGMGLGLSLCRTVIEQHGGALDFTTLRDSQGVALGARFEFSLPAAPMPAADAAHGDAGQTDAAAAEAGQPASARAASGGVPA